MMIQDELSNTRGMICPGPCISIALETSEGMRFDGKSAGHSDALKSKR